MPVITKSTNITLAVLAYAIKSEKEIKVMEMQKK